MNQNEQSVEPIVVKMYLYPSYVTLGGIRGDSRNFLDLLAKHGVELQEEHWGGTVESIPTGEPVIIRTSSVQDARDTDVARVCKQHGHLAFYYEDQLLENGSYTSNGVEEAIVAFVARARATQLPREQVIAYLRSRPADTSTLGEGLHVRRQAAKFVRLFEKFVINGVQYDPTRFRSEYVSVGIDATGATEPRKGLIPGLDSQGIVQLREEIAADKAELEAQGLTPTSDSPVAQAYRAKLYRGLRANLENLELATGMTQTMYEADRNPFGAMLFLGVSPDPMSTFVATFASRHNTDSTSMAVQALYREALPILVEKLVAAGYPDSTDVIDWDYGEPNNARGLRMLSAFGKATGMVSISHSLEGTVSMTCADCGAVANHTTHQGLDDDGLTPKGAPRLVPATCAVCGSANIHSSPHQKD